MASSAPAPTTPRARRRTTRCSTATTCCPPSSRRWAPPRSEETSPGRRRHSRRCAGPVTGRRLTACRRVSDLPSAVAYSACIRSHGVPNFPDPDSSGQVPKADPQGTRCQQHPAPGSPASLPAPVPKQRPYAQRQFTPAMLRIRCLPTGPGAAGGERRTEVRPVHAPRQAWVGGIGAALLIGALAGLLPAIRAARLSPTQALWSI